MPRDDRPGWQAKAALYMGLAFVIPAAMYALWWVGSFLDEKYGTRYGSLVGLMVGFAVGLYEVMRQARQIERR